VGIRRDSARSGRVAGADVSGSVVQTAILSGTAEEEVSRIGSIGRKAGDLCLLRGCRDREQTGLHIAEALLQTDAGLTGPGEADHVLRIDRVGELLGAVIGALPVLGNQRPHLTAGKSEALSVLHLAPDLALTQHVAVALVVVGRGARTQKVGL